MNKDYVHSMQDDTISRQAAQTELMTKCERYTLARESHGFGHVEWSSDLISVADAMDVIRDLPSAQPKKHTEEHTETHSCDCERMETHNWIPVTKKLPEDGVKVWVTIKGHDVIRCEDGETLEQAIARISKIRWVTQGYWSEEEHGWNDPSFGCPLMVRPIAWMPMDTPEPYKGEQDG